MFQEVIHLLSIRQKSLISQIVFKNNFLVVCVCLWSLNLISASKQTGQTESSTSKFHERNSKQAILKDNWKMVVTQLDKEPNYFLFNLENDIAEKNDLASKYPEKVTELKELMNQSRIPSQQFKFNNNEL